MACAAHPSLSRLDLHEGCGTTVRACHRFCISIPRHRHLLRELREHPIQTMSLLRAAPLPTPLKIYGLSLFPAELIPLTSYAGIAVTFNLLRAQHGQDAPSWRRQSWATRRLEAPFALARGTTALRPSSGPLGSRAELRPAWPPQCRPVASASRRRGRRCGSHGILAPTMCDPGGRWCGRSQAPQPAASPTPRTPPRPSQPARSRCCSFCSGSARSSHASRTRSCRRPLMHVHGRYTLRAQQMHGRCTADAL